MCGYWTYATRSLHDIPPCGGLQPSEVECAGGATTEALNRARLPFCWLRFLRSSPRRGNNRVSHPGVQLARAERERRPRVAPTMCKTARTPWVTASVPGTSVNGTIHASWSFCSYHRRPADGRTAWHAARRAARGSSDGTCSIFAGTVACHVVVGFPGTFCVSTARTILRWARTGPLRPRRPAPRL